MTINSSSRSSRDSWWIYINYLSFDAVLVSGVWFIFFSFIQAKANAVELSFIINFKIFYSLLMTVWLLYILDRIIDVSVKKNSQNNENKTSRHLFYKRNKSKMCIAWLIGFIYFIYYVINNLTLDCVLKYIILLLFILLYFYISHYLSENNFKIILKSVICGFVFSFATLYTSVHQVASMDYYYKIFAFDSRLIRDFHLPCLILGTLFMLNCYIISFADYCLPKKNIFMPKILIILMSILFLFTVYLFFLETFIIKYFYFSVSISIILLLFLNLSLISKKISYNFFRLFMDLSLLTPILFITFVF